MPNPTATFDTTLGSFQAELYLDQTPLTASNFIDLANTGFYNGVTFHRVIQGFMLQFGCPYAKDPKARNAGTGGPVPGSQFKNLQSGAMEKRDGREGCVKDEFTAKLSNEPGTLSMANTGAPNSGGSQFFVNTANNANLDWFSPGQSKHPVFGKVISGMDVVKKIESARTDPDDKPVQPVVMNSVTVA